MDIPVHAWLSCYLPEMVLAIRLFSREGLVNTCFGTNSCTHDQQTGKADVNKRDCYFPSTRQREAVRSGRLMIIQLIILNNSKAGSPKGFLLLRYFLLGQLQPSKAFTSTSPLAVDYLGREGVSAVSEEGSARGSIDIPCAIILLLGIKSVVHINYIRHQM